MYPWFGQRPPADQPQWRFTLEIRRNAAADTYPQFSFSFLDSAQSATIQTVDGSPKMGSGSVRVIRRDPGARSRSRAAAKKANRWSGDRLPALPGDGGRWRLRSYRLSHPDQLARELSRGGTNVGPVTAYACTGAGSPHLRTTPESAGSYRSTPASSAHCCRTDTRREAAPPA